MGLYWIPIGIIIILLIIKYRWKILDFIGELLGGGKAGKPIIYFYPEKETEVHVQLNYGGKLTTTYPKYDAAKGWNATIKPNGTLIDLTTQKEYYALYWEGIGLCQFDLSTGFVVKGENVADFLDEKLEQLGLTRREANEFIVYWLPELEVNEYNLIHFAQEKYRDFAKLEISPKPETLIRVFMVYKTLSKSINIQEQVLPAKVERKGFTVVEWGGTKVKNTFSDFVK